MTRCLDHPSRPRRSDSARAVADLLRSDIVAGRYEGDPLPSEADLVEAFGVSRNTVRDALAALRDEGLLERRQGAGTFSVAHKALHRFDRLHGVASSAGAGRNQRFRLVEGSTRPAPELVADHLAVPTGSDVVYLERVMILDGEPFSLRSSWMPADVASPLLRADLRWDHLYELVEDVLDVALRGGHLVVEAVSASHDAAALLGTTMGSPLFFMTHTTEQVDGKPFEFGFTRTRGDRLALLSELPMDPADPLSHPRLLTSGRQVSTARSPVGRKGGVTP